MRPRPDASFDDALWSSRSWYWRDQAVQTSPPRTKNQRQLPALILSGFGVSLRIDGGTLRIRDGFTHHPQKQETFRFFKGDRDLPERIILLDCTGSLSFDVMAWLAEQGVALLKLDWQGHIVSLATPNGYSANTVRLAWQVATRTDVQKRTEFCVRLITAKIEASISTLEKAVRRSAGFERAMDTAYAALTRLDKNEARDVAEVRGIEGTVAAAYFRAWRGLPIVWRRSSRRPIPPDWRRFDGRGSGFYATGNRHARHPANAILNYAYTVLETDVRIWCLAEGFDPSFGIMHESRQDSCALVLDIMEPLRASVDRKVLEIIRKTEFDPADFFVSSEGICRLNPELARWVVQRLFSGGRFHEAADKTVLYGVSSDLMAAAHSPQNGAASRSFTA